MNHCCYNASVFDYFNGSMAHREHPRVQLPLLVELHHPSLNRGRSFARGSAGSGQPGASGERYIARDISEGAYSYILTSRLP